MTIPKEKTKFIDGQRCYVGSHNGVPFTKTSIGGLTGYLNKPAIVGWNLNRAIDFVMTNHDGLIGENAVDLHRTVKGALSGSSPEAERGTNIHSIIEDFLLTGQVSDHPDSKWVIPALTEALADLPHWEVVGVERTVCWIRDDEVLSVGTTDAILRIGGKVWIVDWKSGKKIYPDSAITTAAYAKSTHYLIDGVTVPIPAEDRPEAAVVAHVKKSGIGWHKVTDINLLDPLFEALFAIERWEKETKINIFE